jgi:predicted N-formylglutamate amidohydrolase
MDHNPHDSKNSIGRNLIPLLGYEEPPAFEIYNEGGTCTLLLVCDHASKAVPIRFKNLGLDKSQFERHIAYDIGAAEVTRLLAKRLNSQAILAGYSRLVIDLNRPTGDPQSILEISNGTFIPGNQGLTKNNRIFRVSNLFAPYHNTINKTLAHLSSIGKTPVLFSIHSFSPDFGNEHRPWDIGVLWNRDPRIAKPLMERLRRRGLNVGDNFPYSGLKLAYTIDRHGAAAGFANCVVEINQSQVQDQANIVRWVDILTDVMQEILQKDELYQFRRY